MDLNREQFENDYADVADSESFCQFITKKLEKENYDTKRFKYRTGLNENVFSQLKKESYNPSLKIVVSICIGLRLKYDVAVRVINLAGYSLRIYRKLDYAYSEFLREKNITIKECNKKLKEFGFSEQVFLGSGEYKK